MLSLATEVSAGLTRAGGEVGRGTEVVDVVRKLGRLARPGGGECWASIVGDRAQPLQGRVDAMHLARFFAGENLLADGPELAVADCEWRAPVPEESAVYGVGLNYTGHAQELKGEVLPEPLFFLKAPGSTAASGSPLTLSPVSDTLDYEAELAVVIGRICHRISAAEAMHAVAGYAVANDSTLRAHARPESLLLAKSSPGNTIIGPWITQRQGVKAPELNLQCWVNGELRQQANTAEMLRPVPELIAALSRFLTLRPGDVILTGSPAGVGAAQQPPCYLRPGDEVRIEIETLGTLLNTVRGCRED